MTGHLFVPDPTGPTAPHCARCGAPRWHDCHRPAQPSLRFRSTPWWPGIGLGVVLFELGAWLSGAPIWPLR
jgi:hypothetical protein